LAIRIDTDNGIVVPPKRMIEGDVGTCTKPKVGRQPKVQH